MSFSPVVHINAGRSDFGDIVCRTGPDPDRTVTVVTAPPVAPISLYSLANDPDLTVDGRGICVAGQVWYRPIDLDPGSLRLICQLVDDQRPLPEEVRL